MAKGVWPIGKHTDGTADEAICDRKACDTTNAEKQTEKEMNEDQARRRRKLGEFGSPVCAILSRVDSSNSDVRIEFTY